jgi:hypothetical protein
MKKALLLKLIYDVPTAVNLDLTIDQYNSVVLGRLNDNLRIVNIDDVSLYTTTISRKVG